MYRAGNSRPRAVHSAMTQRHRPRPRGHAGASLFRRYLSAAHPQRPPPPVRADAAPSYACHLGSSPSAYARPHDYADTLHLRSPPDNALYIDSTRAWRSPVRVPPAVPPPPPRFRTIRRPLAAVLHPSRRRSRSRRVRPSRRPAAPRPASGAPLHRYAPPYPIPPAHPERAQRMCADSAGDSVRRRTAARRAPNVVLGRPRAARLLPSEPTSGRRRRRTVLRPAVPAVRAPAVNGLIVLPYPPRPPVRATRPTAPSIHAYIRALPLQRTTRSPSHLLHPSRGDPTARPPCRRVGALDLTDALCALRPPVCAASIPRTRALRQSAPSTYARTRAPLHSQRPRSPSSASSTLGAAAHPAARPTARPLARVPTRRTA
ncbi:hypothetical protein HYPSUDRAFT_813966 [Hypholoma sublateritium FD-334 SS-4]|uniref:Uncharacterized protein n=1 Tax=Hypholoma sublateritium (strain FD-334 SS-4) TaxID=945553 RepID=A0A0D2NNR6_HYPSF|nr:hypothetical protein HYPSUDRAFT_813966 [Hypholoma sublateritium FD-334 SS-4]